MRGAFLASMVAFSVPNTAAGADLAALDRCLADTSRVEQVFSERFPHEACRPLSTCDPKLVISAEVIAKRQCRQEAIAACGTYACTEALITHWATAETDIDTANRDGIKRLDTAALSPLVARRIENYTAQARSCPNDPGVLTAVLGPNRIEGKACDLYLSLTALEAGEAMERMLADLPVKDSTFAPGPWLERCFAQAEVQRVLRDEDPEHAYRPANITEDHCVTNRVMACRFSPDPESCSANLADIVFEMASEIIAGLPDTSVAGLRAKENYENRLGGMRRNLVIRDRIETNPKLTEDRRAEGLEWWESALERDHRPWLSDAISERINSAELVSREIATLREHLVDYPQ